MQQQNTTDYQLPVSIKAETMKLHPTKVLDVESLSNENVHIGSTVKIKDKSRKTYTYSIVGFAQADPAET